MSRLYSLVALTALLGLCVGTAHATLIVIDPFTTSSGPAYTAQDYVKGLGEGYRGPDWETTQPDLSEVLGGQRIIRADRDDGQAGDEALLTGRVLSSVQSAQFSTDQYVTGEGQLEYGTPGNFLVDLSDPDLGIGLLYSTDTSDRSLQATLTLTDTSNKTAFVTKQLSGSTTYVPVVWLLKDFTGCDLAQVAVINLTFLAQGSSNEGIDWSIKDLKGSSIPEPASCALLAVAVGGIGMIAKRRRK